MTKTLTLIREHTRQARKPLKSFGIVSKDMLISENLDRKFALFTTEI